MKRLNIKLLAIVIPLFLLTVAGTHIVHALQVKSNVPRIKDKAAEAREEGDAAKEADDVMEARARYAASIQFSNRYLGNVEEDIEERVALVNVLFTLLQLPDATGRDWRNATNAAEELLSRDSTQDEIRLRLAGLYFGARQRVDALEHLQRILQRQPDHLEALILSAQCHQMDKEEDKAREIFCRIVGFDPKAKSFDRSRAVSTESMGVYFTLAIWARTKDEDEALADRIINEMVEANPASHEAYLMRARYRLHMKQEQGAREDVKTALEIAPDDLNVLVSAAQFTLAFDEGTTSEKVERAKEHLNRAIDLHPDHALPYIQLAGYLAAQRNLTEARECIAQGRKRNPRSARLLQQHLDLALQAGDLEEVTRSIQRAEALGLPGYVVDFFQAKLHAAGGEWIEAAGLLERVRPFVSVAAQYRRPTYLALAQCYTALDMPDLRLDALQRSLEGEGVLEAEGVAEADVGLEAIARNYSPMADEAAVLLELGQSKEALDRYRRLFRRSEESFYRNPILWRALLQLELNLQLARPESERDWTKVDEIVAALPQDHVNAIVLSKVHKARGKVDEARQILFEARKQNPNDLALKLEQINDVAAERGPEEALKQLNLIESELPRPEQRAALRPTRIGLIARGDPAVARGHLAVIEEEVAGESEVVRIGLWAALADAYAAIGDLERARDLYRRIAQAQSDNIRVRMRLFDLAIRAGNDQWCKEVVADLRSLGSNGSMGSLWRFAEAARLVMLQQTSQPDNKELLVEAGKLLDEVTKTRDKWHQVSRLRGDIYFLQGDRDRAIGQYQAALRQGPVNLDTVQRLIQLLAHYRRFEEAEQALDVLGESRNNPTVQRVLATLLIQQGQPQRALEAAKYVVSPESKNAADHLWYGQICMAADKLPEAEQAFRRAVDLNTDSTQAWLALIAAQMEAGDPQRAEATIREAQLLVPEDAQPRMLASAYDQLGKLSEAQHYYAEHLRRNPDNLAAKQAVVQFYLRRANRDSQGGREYLEEARRMLFEIVQADEGDANTAQLKRWSRKRIAELLAQSENYQSLLDGLRLLELNAVDGQLDSDDLRHKALLLSRRPEPELRNQAIVIFQDLRTRRPMPLTADDLVRLAELYDRSGRWIAARNLMSEVVSQNPKNGTYLAKHARMFIRNDEHREAQAPLDALTALARENPSLELIRLSLQSKILAEQNKADEALRQLEKFLGPQLSSSPPVEKSPEKQQLLLAVVDILSKIEQHEPAERILRRLVQVAPQRKLSLAVHLSQHGDLDEAFRIYEDLLTAREVEARRLVGFGLTALRARSQVAQPRHFQIVQDWLDRALRENPESVKILLDQAAFLDTQGKFDRVADIYRTVLDDGAAQGMTPRQLAEVRNNLAFVMADKLGQVDDALELIEQSIRVLGPTAHLLDTRATVHLASGNPKLAIADLELATQDYYVPVRDLILFHLATAYLRNGEVEKAADAFKQAEKAGLSREKLSPAEQRKYDELRTGVLAAN